MLNVRVLVCAYGEREIREVRVRGVLNRSQRLHLVLVAFLFPLELCLLCFFSLCRVVSCFLGCGVALRVWATFVSTAAA